MDTIKPDARTAGLLYLAGILGRVVRDEGLAAGAEA